MTDCGNNESACKSPVVWGTVYDNLKRPLSGRQVRLLQYLEGCDSCLLPVGQTHSDCNGYYEIKIPFPCRGRYRIEISQAEKKHTQKRVQNKICYY